MNKNIFTIATLALTFALNVNAQSEKVNIKVSKSIRPLVEKLVEEYKKDNAGADFEFVSAKAQEGGIQFTTDDEQAVSFARLAVLPVTTKDSEADQLLHDAHLNSKKLKNLFFVKDEIADEDRKETKAEKAVHIYTGNSQQSASRAYAAHFNHEASDFKVKKISGDDSFLNTAISRDPLGVTINSLSNVYDLNSRQVRSDLAIVSLDVDKQSRQVLEQGGLDELIALLEKREIEEIPTANVGLAYNHSDSAASKFAQWVLAHGSEYVHQYGLLQLPQKELAAQAKRTEQENNILACL